MRYAHACVVGGSGMLAGFSRALLDTSDTVSVMARDEAHIRAIDPRIVPLVGDYCSEEDALAALDRVFAERGAPDLVVAWIHTRATALRRGLAMRLRPKGRFVQVLGSAHGDPARPDRLERAAAVTEGLGVTSQLVVLGFTVESGRSRWLTDEEICAGVAGAIRKRKRLSVVGTLAPWSARP